MSTEIWITYVGGYGDEFDCMYHGTEYKILGETELYFIVENALDEEVAIEKYKFLQW